MPTSEQKHDVRRQQLIEATMTCIREYGLDGTTIAKVTQEAGLSNGIVNFYFKTKQELLSETLRSIHTEYHTKINAIFIRRIFNSCVHVRQMYMYLAVTEVSPWSNLIKRSNIFLATGATFYEEQVFHEVLVDYSDPQLAEARQLLYITELH